MVLAYRLSIKKLAQFLEKKLKELLRNFIKFLWNS